MLGTRWSMHWVEAADRTTREGDEHLEEDRWPEARDCYLRSAEYYRLALSGTEFGTAEHRSWSDAQVSAFRAALPLLPYPAVPFTITVEPVTVAGYLFRSAVAPHTMTVLCPAADHIPPESLYLVSAVPILELGRNCVVFGSMRDGTLSAARPNRSDRAPGRVIDSVAQWVLRQPGIDPERFLLPPSNDRTIDPR